MRLPGTCTTEDEEVYLVVGGTSTCALAVGWIVSPVLAVSAQQRSNLGESTAQ